MINVFSRVTLAFKIDTALRDIRLLCVLERLKETRDLSSVFRVENGQELLIGTLVEWCQANVDVLDFIVPGKPSQNAFIEDF